MEYSKKWGISSVADLKFSFAMLLIIVDSLTNKGSKAIREELMEEMGVGYSTLQKYIKAKKDDPVALDYLKAKAAAEYFDTQIPELNIMIDDLYLCLNSQEGKPDPKISPERMGLSK